MLKLEPTEAEGVSLVWPHIRPEKLDEIARELDTLSRMASPDDVQRLADTRILQEEIGLDAGDCSALYEAAASMLERRTFKV